MSAIAILQQQRTTATLLAGDGEYLLTRRRVGKKIPACFFWGETDTSKEEIQ
jgi:hypothetical protein